MIPTLSVVVGMMMSLAFDDELELFCHYHALVSYTLSKFILFIIYPSCEKRSIRMGFKKKTNSILIKRRKMCIRTRERGMEPPPNLPMRKKSVKKKKT